MRIAAKVTHKKYGIRRYPARADILLKRAIVIIIAIQSRMISIKARKGFWSPKKSADHIILRRSCNAKKENAVFFFPLCMD